jgi:hypothetical protein
MQETNNLNEWIISRGSNLKAITLYCNTLNINCILQNVSLVCPFIKSLDLFDQSN